TRAGKRSRRYRHSETAHRRKSPTDRGRVRAGSLGSPSALAVAVFADVEGALVEIAIERIGARSSDALAQQTAEVPFDLFQRRFGARRRRRDGEDTGEDDGQSRCGFAGFQDKDFAAVAVRDHRGIDQRPRQGVDKLALMLYVEVEARVLVHLF